MKHFLLIVGCLCAASSAVAQAPNPFMSELKQFYTVRKGDLLKAADRMPAADYDFKPTPDVRTFGQLIAHIADGQYEFCGPAKGESVNKDVEKTAKTKAAVVTALKESFAYCDAAYSKMTAATAAQMVTSFGGQMTRLGVMDFNTAHTMEHYGNLVTYMRLKGIVPPSSQK